MGTRAKRRNSLGTLSVVESGKSRGGSLLRKPRPSPIRDPVAIASQCFMLPTSMPLTRRVRVELRVYAIRVIAIDPDVSVIVGLEPVRLVDLGLRVVDHRVVRHALERRRRRIAGSLPRLDEHEVLHGDEL
jgi:hypothetical protein